MKNLFYAAFAVIYGVLSTVLFSQNFWAEVPLEAPVYSIAFNSQGHIFLGSDSVKIYRSTDGGQSFEKFFVRGGGDNWDTVDNIVINSVDSLFVTLRFASLSSKSTWRSGDNGQTWTNIFNTHFSALVIDSNDKIYASRWETSSWILDPPKIQVSTDHGDTWTQINKQYTYALALNSQNHIFIGTYNEGIERSTDGGATWDSVFFDGNVTTGLLKTTADQKIHALYGSYASSDTNGENWIRNQPVLGWILSLGVSGNDVYAGYFGGGVYKTSDAGVTWTQLDTSGLQNHLWFEELNQIAVDQNGYLWIAANNVSLANKKLFRSAQPVTAIEGNKNIIPNRITLDQNYPNPFNPSTTISFTLPKAQFVTLTVYDMLGRKITTLVNRRVAAGHNEIQFDGQHLASGVYLYQLKTSDISLETAESGKGLAMTRKMMLIK